jgi:oligopeptide/dipeptide ABC transporter ATP-binding protein
MELFRRLRRERGLSILLISHNLHLVAEMCDRVAVMYAGRIVECGTSEEVFLRPHHPYTRLLQECVPTLDHRGKRPTNIPGSAPRPGEILAGCHFAPRCPRVSELCFRTSPILEGTNGHSSACWHPEKSLERAVGC